MVLVERTDRSNLFSLVNVWILCGILLVYASVYGFSFERGSLNSFGGDTQALEAGDSTLNAVVSTQALLVYFLCVVCALPFIRPIWRQVRSNLLIFSILGWAFTSVLWSPKPSTSAINSMRLAINLIFLTYLFERYSANDLKKLMMLVGSVAAAGSIFLVLVFPQYGLQLRNLEALGAWQGIFGQKNLLGLELLVLLLPAFYVKTESLRARRLRAVYVAVLLGLIIMSRSAGAWVDTFLCLAFVTLLYVTTRMPKKEAFILVMAIVIPTITAVLIVLGNFNSIMYGLGKDPTMTGRTILWSGLINLAMKRPMIGYGYVAFWQGLNGPSRYLALQMHWLGLAGAENGVLELGLELGAVGLLLYAAIFLRAVRDAFYCLGRGASPAAMWYMSILSYVVATNIEGGQLLMPSNLASMMPFVAYLGLRREVRLLRERQIG